MEPTILSTSILNQWVLDFQGNTNRIIESIKYAKDQHNSKIRIGPELEVPGYSCEDHFYEIDTVYHSWQSLVQVLELTKTRPYDDILCSIGMPVFNRGVLYNCDVIIYSGKVILIRPKLTLCDDGNYRESRWFTQWTNTDKVMEFVLPAEVRKATKQRLVPFGNAMLETGDGYLIGFETCEELWGPIPTSTNILLQGAHIVINQSGSHFNLAKITYRKHLIKNATVKTGGAYIYSNLRGCDGCRLYFDGAGMIALNGEFVKIGKQFSLKEVEVISACIDLYSISEYRTNILGWSSKQSSTAIPVIKIPEFTLVLKSAIPDIPQGWGQDLEKVEEIAFGPACFLWDFLRRSRAAGYFLPLSGGCDSCSTLTIIGVMSQLVIEALQKETGHNLSIIQEDLMRMIGEIPQTPQALVEKLVVTAYLGTSNSTEQTKSRARILAGEVGSRHLEVNMDPVVAAFMGTFCRMTGSERPKFMSQGGTYGQDVALQNIQARSRMVISYFIAQMAKNENLLVLGSANLEEGLTGYMTKYDCSSADINPIGGISKQDLKAFLLWASENRGFPSLVNVVQAPPTAELRPSDGGAEQTDEDDLGMTYAEMNIMGRLRKVEHLGLLYAYHRLINQEGFTPQMAAQKAIRFYTLYARNRHKMTVVTPALHVENYSADDNRFDMRPIFKIKLDYALRAIEKHLKENEGNEDDD